MTERNILNILLPKAYHLNFLPNKLFTSSTWIAKAASLSVTTSGISPVSGFCVALESLFLKEFLLFTVKA